MSYTPYTVPLRTPLFDPQGRFTRPWIDFLTVVSRKAGRSVTWRDVYSDSLEYAVCDVVRLATDGSLWIALQAQPINGRTVTPGTDETVWQLILRPGEAANGVPAGGTDGQILAKASNTDYDTEWVDAPTGGGGGVTLPIAESDVTNLVSDLALKAPLASPTFTGDPKAPTPSPGDNDTSIATTAFVTAAVAASAVTLPIAESDVTNLVSDLALKAPLASPTFTGDPKAPTPTAGDNDTSIATTAFVTNAVSTAVAGAGTVSSVALSMPAEFSVSGSPVTGSGTITISKANESANTVFAGPTTGSATTPTFRALVAADIPNIAESQVTNLVSDLALKAPLASPALTGTPTAPTASAGTATTQIATTAFVDAAVGPGGSGAYFAWGGDGSDGSVTFNGSSTVLTLVPSSSVYTLSRDICCTDLTVNAGVTIKTANYAIFCTGTCTVNGTIHNDGQTGNNGTTATSATGGGGGSVGIRTTNPGGNSGHYTLLNNATAGVAGGNGGTTTGSLGTAGLTGSTVGASTPFDASGVAGSTGAASGKGGTGASGAGGVSRTGGAGGGISSGGNVQTGRHAAVAMFGITWNQTTPHAVWASNGANGGAAGGSGGGGDTTNSGGGGGGGGGEGGCGGVVGIFAHTIVIGAAGIVRSNGGNGGNGGNGRTPTVGNCGGGGGGGGGSGGIGGIVWLVYHRLTNSGTVQANGGTAGTGGTKGSPSGTGTNDATNGSDGSTGPAGNIGYIPC